jgi:phage replisome organizer N-terminal domain protein
VSLLSDNKKYYYIRLKDSFFDSDEMKVMESMKDGYLYGNILLKLYLRSLKNNGCLMLNERIPYNAEMLATITGHQVGTVKQALTVFKDLGLIEVLDNGAIYMLDIQNFIGNGSSDGDSKRANRRGITDKCPTNVRQMSTIVRDRDIDRVRERDRDKDKDRNKDRDRDTENIISFLNSTTGSKYKASTDKTRRLIAARLAEGFALEDFKTVISKKAKEWQGTDMAQYLRPETLFGTKFEGYLNQPEVRNNRRSPLSRAEQERQETINVVNELIAEYEEEERQNGQSKHDESNSTASIGF